MRNIIVAITLIFMTSSAFASDWRIFSNQDKFDDSITFGASTPSKYGTRSQLYVRCEPAENHLEVYIAYNTPIVSPDTNAVTFMYRIDSDTPSERYSAGLNFDGDAVFVLNAKDDLDEGYLYSMIRGMTAGLEISFRTFRGLQGAPIDSTFSLVGFTKAFNSTCGPYSYIHR